MTALEIIGMILLLFLLLSLLRVGVIVDFGGELRVRLRVGPVKLTVLPRKEKKAQKKAAEAAGKTPEEKTKPKAAGGHRLPKLSFPELRELAGTVLGAHPPILPAPAALSVVASIRRDTSDETGPTRQARPDRPDAH